MTAEWLTSTTRRLKAFASAVLRRFRAVRKPTRSLTSLECSRRLRTSYEMLHELTTDFQAMLAGWSALGSRPSSARPATPSRLPRPPSARRPPSGPGGEG